jgi:PDZ domain-containing protein
MEEPTQSLPPIGEQLGATRRSVWHWAGGIAGFVLLAGVVGGLLFRVPYVALLPGTARDTENLVEVEGVEAYPSDGELLFTTVRVRQRPNLWEYLWLQTDDDAEILAEDLILEGRTLDENRRFNLDLMNDSKEIAIAVALEQLGYDAIGSDGVVVAEVEAGSAADGLLTPGDTMVEIDGRPVQVTQDLLEALSRRSPGDEISILIEPFDHAETADAAEGGEGGEGDEDGETGRREVTVVLGARDDDPQAAFLGIGPSDRVTVNDDFGFEVDIDSGSVGGPSAGLAFTLAVLDQLTPGELTGGATVAVTGTIDAAGGVGPVGGVVQKTAAVRDMGADLFIIPGGLPAAELGEVMARAGDDLKVVPVDNLDEALIALATLGGEVDALEEYAAGNLS